MLTVNKIGRQIYVPAYEIFCLSTDTKRTDVPNGSIIYEIDTSSFYVFDQENKEWGLVDDVAASDQVTKEYLDSIVAEINNKIEALDPDTTINNTSTNSVQNKAIASRLGKLGASATSSGASITVSPDIIAAPNINSLIQTGETYQAVSTGKNLLNNTLKTQKKNGLTFIVNNDKSVRVFGTATTQTELVVGEADCVANTNYVCSGCPDGGCIPEQLRVPPISGTYYLKVIQLPYWIQEDGSISTGIIHTSYRDFGDIGNGYVFKETTNRASGAFVTVSIVICEDITIDEVFYPMVELGDSKTSYEPYTNKKIAPSQENPQKICGLIGYDTYNEETGEYSFSEDFNPEADSFYYAVKLIDQDGNVSWCGTKEKTILYENDTLDFVSGKIIHNNELIDSYNGETINSPWHSSIDEYTEGATPSIGASVLHPLSTPTESVVELSADIATVDSESITIIGMSDLALTYRVNNDDSKLFQLLAKIAGDTTQEDTENDIGIYTENAKSAIRNMIGAVPLVTYGDETVLVDTTTVSFSKDGDNDWYISAENPIDGFTSAQFSYDMVYKVEWDGVIYDGLYCRFSSKENGESGWYEWSFIGNIEPLGYNGGNSSRVENLPFCIEYDYKRNKAEVQIISYDTAGSHTVKISSRPVTKTLIENTLFLDSYHGIPLIRLGEKGGVLEGLANYAAEYAHAEGECTNASGACAHAEGGITKATGECAHAEGWDTAAAGWCSHAEGYDTVASGDGCAHVEGYVSSATGFASHAEGLYTVASGGEAHTEGYNTAASAVDAHAEGDSTVASGENSHAQNRSTIAQGVSQTAIGRFNIAQGTADSKEDTDYAIIVGNGTSDDERSNAFALRWDGAFVAPDNETVYKPWEKLDSKGFVPNAFLMTDADGNVVATVLADADSISYGG